MILLALFFAYDDEGIPEFSTLHRGAYFRFPSGFPIHRKYIFVQIVFLESLDRFESAELRVVLHETIKARART